MPKTPPDGSQRIVPMLAYADARAALEFLCKAFGFEERYRLDMPDGRVGHAEIAYQDNVVMLASVYPEIGAASPLDLPGLHSQLHCWVDDVDAHFVRARDAGATVVGQPEDQFHGARSYRAVDPGGHRWIFSTQVRDVSPEEMKAHV